MSLKKTCHKARGTDLIKSVKPKEIKANSALQLIRSRFLIVKVHHANMLIGCGGFNEMHPHRLISLNTWSPVSGTVWERLGLTEGGVSVGAGFESSQDLQHFELVLSIFCELWAVPTAMSLLHCYRL